MIANTCLRPAHPNPISGGKMAIGHRNRSALAADGATGIPWVIGGLSLVAASAGIVAVFL